MEIGGIALSHLRVPDNWEECSRERWSVVGGRGKFCVQGHNFQERQPGMKGWGLGLVKDFPFPFMQPL